ncbi:hypothetical protein JS562_53775 [Agrobacterium sp. S2]|nr:hypothetical protein [Agrobacterium sp. S2]
MYPHQVTTSGHLHHSDAQASASAPPGKGSWTDLIEDYGELEAWLEGDIGFDIATDYNAAYDMWEHGAHPINIRNTILANRRSTA